MAKAKHLKLYCDAVLLPTCRSGSCLRGVSFPEQAGATGKKLTTMARLRAMGQYTTLQWPESWTTVTLGASVKIGVAEKQETWWTAQAAASTDLLTCSGSSPPKLLSYALGVRRLNYAELEWLSKYFTCIIKMSTNEWVAHSSRL